MKKFLFLLLLFSGMAKAQIVNIPDPAFKAYLLSASFTNNIAMNSTFSSAKIDANSDGEIQVAEAADILRLWIEDIQITNVQGLEAFTNLEEMTIKGTSLTSFGLDMPFLPKFQITQNPLLASVSVAGMPNLNQLDCIFNPVLTTVNAANCDLLVHAALNNNNLATLNLSNLPGLVNLYCQNNQLTSLNVSNCDNLHGIIAAYNPLTAIDVSGLTQLAALDVSNNVSLTSLNASGCSALGSGALNLTNNLNLTDLNLSNCTSFTIFAIVGTSLNYLNVSGCTNLTDLQVQNNDLTTLIVDGCPSLLTLICSSNQITSLDLSDSPALQYLFATHNAISDVNFNENTNLIQCTLYNNQLVTLDFSGMSNLIVCQIQNNPLMLLDISGCTSLTTTPLSLDTNVTSLNMQGCSAIESIYIISPQLQTLNMQGCASMINVRVQGTDGVEAPVSTFDFSDMPNLATLDLFNTSVTTLDLSANSNLVHFSAASTLLTTLDLSNQANLTTINVNSTPLELIDISASPYISLLQIYECHQLQTILAKNGSSESINFGENTALQFICQDEEFIISTQSSLNDAGLNTVVCNSYCTMTPGGNFNSIGGVIRFDTDNNGCDNADMVHPNMKININDGTNSGATFTDAAGVYALYTGAGNFDVSLGFENPSLFSVNPATAAVAFADTDNNTTIQDFCVTAIGSQNDAEIVIAPITPARPGFSALYQIVIKNKGNQTLNGNFNFAFDDTLMDFVVATTTVTSQSTGMLNWNYSNLLPFENRSVYVLLNVNSPTQTPPVNQDDILNFTATINPIVNDINATDNQFVYNQSVVNSFDPNDITCMQGETLSPQDIGKYLHYVVNFENTGTYQAEQVVVKIVIDETKYDINTLQLLNTSHTVRPVIKGNTAEFFFEGINLAAAAGNPPVGGHGNILFKIRTLPSLATGDEVIAKADIFFDYNSPIATNEARTAFITLSTPDNVKDQSVVLYPNPAKNFVTIECDNIIRSVDVYDIQGRILEILKRDSNAVTIDVSNRANGIYFVKIITDKGMQVQKIVKE